jgi:hypothetical protein
MLGIILGTIAVGAISGFAVIQIWPEIDIFAQRLRAAAVATIGPPERVYAVPEPAVTPRPATSSNSTDSTSSNTTEASIPAIGSPSKAQAVNSQTANRPPLEGGRVLGCTEGSRRSYYCIGTRALGSRRQGAPLRLACGKCGQAHRRAAEPEGAAPATGRTAMR